MYIPVYRTNMHNNVCVPNIMLLLCSAYEFRIWHNSNLGITKHS